MIQVQAKLLFFLQFVALNFAREVASEKKYKRRGIVKQKLGTQKWRLPIFIPLRAIINEQKFVNWPKLIGLSPYLQYPDGYFERQLQRGRCILLLDGLDEVKSDDEQKSVAEAIVNLASPPFSNNQYIVSCRIAGWRNYLPSDFAKVVVKDFNQDEIGTFIRTWYRAVKNSQVFVDETTAERQIRETKIEERATELIDTLYRNERLRRLARNPLLLSIIAIVHRTRVVLPRQRAKLYRECTELLLEQWDIARGIQVDDTGLSLRSEAGINASYCI